MKKYTLNERGKTIWVYFPTVILIVLFTSTNILDLIVTWTFG